MGPEKLTAAENIPHKESEVNYRREWVDDYIRYEIREKSYVHFPKCYVCNHRD